MADDNPDFPGLKMPKGKPASETQPTIVPKSQGTGGAPPKPASVDPDFPGLILPKGQPGGGAAASPETQNSFFYDLFHPSPADLNRPQTWRDWATKTYNPSLSDFGRAALDDETFGTGDWARSKVTGENLADLRARTANSQAALGPMGPVVNAATYMFGGPGKIIGKLGGRFAPTIGRYGAAAAEGGTASGLSSAGHQTGGDTFDIDKVIKDTAKGMVLGTVAQGVGDVTAPAVQRVMNYTTGKPGVAGETQWDWRTRAGMDDPTLPTEVAVQQAVLPADHPAQPGLTKLRGALAQSTEPGRVADAASAGVGYGVNYALGGVDNVAANWASAAGPALYSGLVGNPVAKTINTYDRNINVGQALDQLYPALYNTKPTTTDVSGWAPALHGLTIGGQRPNEGNAQWW